MPVLRRIIALQTILIYKDKKMDIKLPYGKEELSINIDQKNLTGLFYPNEVEKKSATSLINQSLKEHNFEKFMETDERVIFIVNDGTRPTPTAKILKEFYDKIKDKDIYFIIATGAHREPTVEEYHYIFGQEIYEDIVSKNRLWSHDSRNDEMVFLGKSGNGTEMYLNKIVAEAKKVVAIGSVEPHYFAGYTGGRKAFLPGVAAHSTITMNHKLALKLEATALALEGNPVHEDMMDAMKVLKNIDVFAIMSVLDRDHDIYAVTAGDLEKSFYDAIDRANEVFCVEIPEKSDIVISAAPYPMDIDLYQSQKAIDNGKLALKENGILIFLSQCRMGIGDEAFYDLMSSCKTAPEVIEKIKQEYKLGYHKACKMAEINLWAETWGVTEMDGEKLRAVHIKPFDTLEEALSQALKEKGEDATITVLPLGSLTVPLIKE